MVYFIFCEELTVYAVSVYIQNIVYNSSVA